MLELRGPPGWVTFQGSPRWESYRVTRGDGRGPSVEGSLFQVWFLVSYELGRDGATSSGRDKPSPDPSPSAVRTVPLPPPTPPVPGSLTSPWVMRDLGRSDSKVLLDSPPSPSVAGGSDLRLDWFVSDLRRGLNWERSVTVTGLSDDHPCPDPRTRRKPRRRNRPLFF